ncbi:hypothetical protein ACTA71_001519 [Dictyostelium dimigraforme]
MLNLNRSFKIKNFNSIRILVRNYSNNNNNKNNNIINNNDYIDNIGNIDNNRIKKLIEYKTKEQRINENKFSNKIKNDKKDKGMVPKKFNNSHIMERDPEHRSLSLKQYFEVLANLGEVDKMLKVAIRMPERRSLYTYEKLIYACAKSSQFKKSWSIYNDMKKDNIKPSIFIFGNLVNVCNTATGVDANKIEERVNKIIEEIEKGGSTISTNFFNILMKTMINIGKSGQAISMVEKMKESGIKVDIVTYSTLLKAMSEQYLADNNLNKKKLLREFKPDKNTMEMDELRAEGNKQIDRYMTIVKMVKTSQIAPDRYFINTILSACGQTSNPAGVFRVWDTLQEMKLTQHLNPDTKTYDILITTCNNIDDFDRSLAIFEELYSKNIRPDIHLINNMFRTVLRIVSCKKFSRKKHLDHEEIIKRILDYMSAYKLQPNETTFSVLISIYSKAKEYPKVYELFTEMKQFNIKPDITHYSSIINSFSRKPAICLEIFKVLVSQKVVLTPDFTANLQKILSNNNGDVEEFSRLLRIHESYAYGYTFGKKE